MQAKNAKKRIFILLCIIGIALCNGLSAEEYHIGVGDVLKVSFWQDPTLDQEVRVRQDGKITLSIIGEIDAVGSTSSELANKIERSVSLYNSRISQAAVTVTEFNSQSVYLSGQVGTPGKYSFEVIPDLWAVIKEAGGATEMGDLSRVTIIRSKENGGEIITVNILEAIAKGKLGQLPELKKDDTVEIPRVAGGVPGQQLASDYDGRKNLYYVTGEVKDPGAKTFEGNLDIMDAIGAAGGISEHADLKNIQILSKNGQGTTSLKFDLTRDLDNGRARRVIINPEDMVIVGQQKQGILTWSRLRDLLAVAGTVTSLYFVFNSNN